MTLEDALRERMEENRITAADLAREARADVKRIRKIANGDDAGETEIRLLLDAAGRIIERKRMWRHG